MSNLILIAHSIDRLSSNEATNSSGSFASRSQVNVKKMRDQSVSFLALR